MNSAIAIIGGADGPTEIFVSSPFLSLFDGMTGFVAAALILAIVAAYFIGNISPAILIGRMHGINIKKEGSGNAGTTNVLRVLGKKAAAATLLIDILKGVIAVLLGMVTAYLFAPLFFPILPLACGLAVFCGHIWPAAFGFKGGKGVATAFGVIVAVKPLLGLVLIVFVAAIIALTRRVSAGSVIGAIAFPFLIWIFNRDAADWLCQIYILWAGIVAAIVLIKHRSNIRRLIKGEEPKISFKK